MEGTIVCVCAFVMYVSIYGLINMHIHESIRVHISIEPGSLKEQQTAF